MGRRGEQSGSEPRPPFFSARPTRMAPNNALGITAARRDYMRMVHCFVCFRSISRSDMPGRFQHACAGRQTASRLRAEAEGEAPAASAKTRGLSPGRKRRSAPSANGRESASDGFGAGLEGKSSVLRSARSGQAHAVESAQCVGGADLTSGPQLGRGRKARHRQCCPHSDRGV